ncbi:hypothetical protein GUJ93_ZPchr0011g27546 [Zizania palustris]|uniref:Uncharacterized protein n=1 Tax=Zizania palustris TaxID=103762 RepID=A0A8J6BN77_ZIZPA|nr:hypothetical protein GUJ93_ZPchr0011g27546 [Zizania palustris]
MSDLEDLFNDDNSKDSDEEIARQSDGLALQDDNIEMTTEGDSIPRPDEDNHMDTEEGDSIPRRDEDNHMDTEDAIFSIMTTLT